MTDSRPGVGARAAASPDSLLAEMGVCVFDAYGTLFDVSAAAERSRGSLGDKTDAVAGLWRAKQLEYTWLRSLMASYVDFERITADALAYALDAFDLPAAELQERLMLLYRSLDAYPEVRPVLQALRERGIRTAILSNGAPGMLAAAVASAGLSGLLEAVLSVDGIGLYKPHPSVYQLAVDRLAVPAGAIAFVSANGWDIAGASHFGFRCVWVNRFGQRPERLPGAPLAELRDLRGLPRLFGAAA